MSAHFPPCAIDSACEDCWEDGGREAYERRKDSDAKALVIARATIKRLNRRLGEYESALAEKVSASPNHRSLGRALANYAAIKASDERDRYREVLEQIASHDPGADAHVRARNVLRSTGAWKDS